MNFSMRSVSTSSTSLSRRIIGSRYEQGGGAKLVAMTSNLSHTPSCGGLHSRCRAGEGVGVGFGPKHRNARLLIRTSNANSNREGGGNTWHGSSAGTLCGRSGRLSMRSCPEPTARRAEQCSSRQGSSVHQEGRRTRNVHHACPLHRDQHSWFLQRRSLTIYPHTKMPRGDG